MTKNQIWGGRFEGEPSDLLRAFNDSFSFDVALFAEDVEGSIAWTEALQRAGTLTHDESKKITVALCGAPPPSAAPH